MVDKKIYIIQGEVAAVVGAIKRNSRWNTHTPLVSVFRPVASDHTTWFKAGWGMGGAGRRPGSCVGEEVTSM